MANTKAMVATATKTEDRSAAAGLIDAKIKDVGGWRGETLARIRRVIHQIDIGEGAGIDETAFKALIRAAVALNTPGG